MTFRDQLYVLFLGSLLISGIASADTLYKSVGPDGRVVYSDRPPADGKVEKIFAFSNMPATPLPESVTRYRQGLQKSLQTRLSNPQKPGAGVRLFTAEWCGYCRKAKAYLAEKSISYQEYDIDTPDGKLAFAQAGSGGGIPLLLWQGQQLQGFSRAGYDALFGRSK